IATMEKVAKAKAETVKADAAETAADANAAKPIALSVVDAPNYRRSPTKDIRCATCSNAVGTYCKKFEFTFKPDHLCDAWEADPPGDSPAGRRSLPPPRREGEPGIDHPDGFTPES